LSNYKEERPWGSFENLLEAEDCKVKQIVINPGESPSYQYHHKRSEVYVVIRGLGELKLDDEIIAVSPNQILEIPLKSKHQIKNIGKEDLVFIEVQLGEYFGEDDIVRVEDKYGRL
jgi:mannose-6-phosphate isomerase-like protein (cupin superfamily)